MKLKKILKVYRQKIIDCYSDNKTPSDKDITKIDNEAISQIHRKIPDKDIMKMIGELYNMQTLQGELMDLLRDMVVDLEKKVEKLENSGLIIE